MRTEGNPLDLNNLPEDYNTLRGDGKQTSEDSSSSAVGVGGGDGVGGGGGGYRKKKSGGGKDIEGDGKVYECRFCSLKFCKSQALGGHMNRHRQERETETLNKARQLVFSNDMAPPGHLGYVSSVSSTGQPNQHGGYHQATNMGDQSLPFNRSIFPTRMFSTSSIPLVPPPPQQTPQTSPYMYTNSSPRMLSFPANQYPPPVNDYFVGHVLTPTTDQYQGNYTCIGAPVGPPGFPNNGGGGGGDLSTMQNQEEGLNLNWGRR